MCHDKFSFRFCFETAEVEEKHEAYDYCTYFRNDVTFYCYSTAFFFIFCKHKNKEKCSKMKLLVKYINYILNYSSIK